MEAKVKGTVGKKRSLSDAKIKQLAKDMETRKKKKMTIADLAEKYGISVATLYNSVKKYAK